MCITGIYDDEGNYAGGYVYDAWGNHKVLNAEGNEDNNPDSICNINPFRYRGYYFDTESGLYYLNSRYYDPEVGRFISIDTLSILDETKGQINGLNLYMYCGNNPVSNYDPDGNFFFTALIAGLLIGTIIGAVTGGIYATATGQDFWNGVLTGALIGGFAGLGIGFGIGLMSVGIGLALGGSAIGGALLSAAGGGFALATVMDLVNLSQLDPNVDYKKNNLIITNSYMILTPGMKFAYSVYYRYLSGNDFVKGSATGMYAEWAAHNLAYYGLSFISLFKDLSEIGLDDDLESAQHLDIGQYIYSDNNHRKEFGIFYYFLNPLLAIIDWYRYKKVI